MHAWRPVLHACFENSPYLGHWHSQPGWWNFKQKCDVVSAYSRVSCVTCQYTIGCPGQSVPSGQCGLLVRTGSGVGPVRWCELSDGWTSSARTRAMGLGRCRGWWVWVSVLYCQHQPPARVNGPVGTRQCRAGCHQPLQRKILSLKWTLVAIPYCEGNSLWWDNARKKIYYCGWIGAMLSSLACGHSSVILITQL